MDNHKKENQPRDNDIDLGSLLTMAGRGLASFGRGIRAALGGLGTALVTIIVFLKRRFIWLLIAIGAGIAWGTYAGADVGPRYFSEMTARFNFKSTLTLYNTIDYLNALIGARKHSELARLLNLSQDEAEHLSGFSAEPIIDELTISELYNQNFLLFDRSSYVRTDTFWTRIIPYEKFKSSLTKFDIPNQRVKAMSSFPDGFQKIQAGLLKLITENENLKNNYAISAQSQAEEEHILMSSIRGLDTLRSVYNEKLRQGGSLTPSGATSVNVMDNVTMTNPELQLYDKVLGLKDELRSLRNYEMSNGRLVMVYASFNPVGKKLPILQQNIIYTTLTALIIVLVILVSIEGYRVITAYEKRTQIVNK